MHKIFIFLFQYPRLGYSTRIIIIFLLCFRIQDLIFSYSDIFNFLLFSPRLFFLRFQNFIHKVPKCIIIKSFTTKLHRAEKSSAFNDGAIGISLVSRLILNTLKSLTVRSLLELSQQLFRRSSMARDFAFNCEAFNQHWPEATPEQCRSRSVQSLNYSGM